MSTGVSRKLIAMRRAQRGEEPRNGREQKWVRMKAASPKAFKKLWQAEEAKEVVRLAERVQARRVARGEEPEQEPAHVESAPEVDDGDERVRLRLIELGV